MFERELDTSQTFLSVKSPSDFANSLVTVNDLDADALQ